MNKNHDKYPLFLDIQKNWPLDDWSINRECFEKIVEILDFDKTILELGSGASTKLLSQFYNMISVEDDEKYINLHQSTYIQAKLLGKDGYDFSSLSNKLRDLKYDLIIIDGPTDGRHNIINHMNVFDMNVPIIWDDTQVYEKYAIEMSFRLNRKYTTYQCKPQQEFWRNYSNGKRFTLIEI